MKFQYDILDIRAFEGDLEVTACELKVPAREQEVSARESKAPAREPGVSARESEVSAREQEVPARESRVSALDPTTPDRDPTTPAHNSLPALFKELAPYFYTYMGRCAFTTGNLHPRQSILKRTSNIKKWLHHQN
ncbi:hypothetical protein A374_17809 [Fictibacillus macauensis ZFHKF-1]|uniref:Uncharacterized protein n=1 Tax=Fictibacillus macauensis ZFHKF-1 TaxID=1196324 RepID=I8UAE2_9BACL|nr:hypothetical protein A374_17809 [Fictibacillus macauensis ZFHKF-1]